MKISTKGRYGLRILLDIALYKSGNKPRMIREIAANQEISEKYISRLIIELRRAGFVQAIRGANGGFVLARKPEAITILEVIEVMEGPLAIVECAGGGKSSCTRQERCPAQHLWRDINQRVRAAFGDYTLQDLLNLYVERGEGVLDYCI